MSYKFRSDRLCELHSGRVEVRCVPPGGVFQPDDHHQHSGRVELAEPVTPKPENQS